jgi:hypothetical protein
MTVSAEKTVWQRRLGASVVAVLATSPELVRRAPCKVLVVEAMPADSGVANEEPRERTAVVQSEEEPATWESCNNRVRKMAKNKPRVKRIVKEVKMWGRCERSHFSPTRSI